MTDRPIAANDSRRTGATTSVLIRRAIFALIALVSLGALSLAALPWIASTQLVRNRIAIELSAWSGFRVAIASTPQIEVFPTFKAVLAGVTLYQWGDWDNPAVIEAERVEINLSAIEALNGNVSFSQVKLVNPVIRMGTNIGEPGPEFLTSSGRIAQAVETTRDLIAADPDKPDFSRFPTTPFGTVEFSNGRVVKMIGDQQHDVVTRLSGKVIWPALNASGSVSLRGTWRGEEVGLELSSASPLALLAGAATTMNAALTSEPLKVTWQGEVRRAGEGRIDGNASIDIPSVRRAIAWANAGISTGSAIGSIKFESRITGQRGVVTLPGTTLTLDSNEGHGDLALKAGTRPAVSGALAFDMLDVQSLVSVFTPLMSYDRVGSDGSATLLHEADFDIGVSARKATLDRSELTDVKGQLTSGNGRARFLIEEAKGFGGDLSLALDIDESSGNPIIELSINANSIKGGDFGTAIGFPNVIPHSKGDLKLTLKGSGGSLDTMLNYADGSLSAHFGKGRIEGIDLEALVAKTASGGFFPLTDIAKGSLAIDAADFEATILHGVGRIKKGEVRAGTRIVFLSGILPYAGRGVALSGTVASRDKVSLFNPNGREASFFVGGSWDAPFVSAALPPQTLQ
ncbi:MAG: AsmA family protein [Rhizobiaceae bacterium]|nr:AsmA family protein [Rhizobiaceae bacterium]